MKMNEKDGNKYRGMQAGYGQPEHAIPLTRALVCSILPERRDDSHKGTYGRSLVIGGCGTFAGAALLCTAACLRTGSGITCAAVPAGIRDEFYCLPEAICISCGNGYVWDDKACRDAERAMNGMTAVAVGPGMGDIERFQMIGEILGSGVPAVIDADGLNCIAKHRELLGLLHEKTVITPHPGEMSRLIGMSVEEILSSPVKIAMAVSDEYGCAVLLKGSKSYIAQRGIVYRNETGDSSLSKGGSGDILTGIILSMLAQGLPPLEAACAGSYLLGACGKDAEKLLEKRMLLGRDVIAMISETIGDLRL